MPCCYTRNRFLLVRGRSVVWLRSILTLMAECDRSKWKRRIYCCDDCHQTLPRSIVELWKSSFVLCNCEMVVSCDCWSTVLFVMNLRLDYLCQWNGYSYVAPSILMDFKICFGTCRFIFLNVPLVSTLRGVCHGTLPLKSNVDSIWLQVPHFLASAALWFPSRVPDRLSAICVISLSVK